MNYELIILNSELKQMLFSPETVRVIPEGPLRAQRGSPLLRGPQPRRAQLRPGLRVPPWAVTASALPHTVWASASPVGTASSFPTQRGPVPFF